MHIAWIQKYLNTWKANLTGKEDKNGYLINDFNGHLLFRDISDSYIIFINLDTIGNILKLLGDITEASQGKNASGLKIDRRVSLCWQHISIFVVRLLWLQIFVHSCFHGFAVFSLCLPLIFSLKLILYAAVCLKKKKKHDQKRYFGCNFIYYFCF